MHGVDGEQRLLKPELAHQSLNRRDLVGLFVALEMRQYQGSIRCERTENMGRLAVVEAIKALTQRFAVDDNVTPPLWGGLSWSPKTGQVVKRESRP